MLSIAKSKAKNCQIFICNRFRADAIISQRCPQYSSEHQKGVVLIRGCFRNFVFFGGFSWLLEILEFVVCRRGLFSNFISWDHGFRGFRGFSCEKRTTPFLSNPLPALLKAKNFMTSSGCATEGANPRKENRTNCTGCGTILKLLWGRNMLYFPGFGDLQPCDTYPRDPDILKTVRIVNYYL